MQYTFLISKLIIIWIAAKKFSTFTKTETIKAKLNERANTIVANKKYDSLSYIMHTLYYPK
jgi:hypothetical protein